MAKTPNNSNPDPLEIFIFKSIIVLIGFFIWFFLIGIFDKVAGAIVGLATAIFLIIAMHRPGERM